jgi:hypothetical protein
VLVPKGYARVRHRTQADRGAFSSLADELLADPEGPDRHPEDFPAEQRRVMPE